MARFSLLLVAVDLSPWSAQALRVAADLAGELGAAIRAIHVVRPSALELPEAAPDDADAGSVMDAHRAALARFVAAELGEATGVELLVSGGDPAAEVVLAAESTGADLIVMGTHGRTGLRHLLLGSVAEQVVREARVPVMVVKRPSGD